MNTRQLADELYQGISELVIIDAHEHLPPESHRLALEVDAVTLFENYPRFELIGAGMTDDQYAAMIDRELPVDERWHILRDFLPLIRQTSAARTNVSLGKRAVRVRRHQRLQLPGAERSHEGGEQTGHLSAGFSRPLPGGRGLEPVLFQDTSISRQLFETAGMGTRSQCRLCAAPSSASVRAYREGPETIGFLTVRLQGGSGRLAPAVPIQRGPWHKAAVSNYSVSTAGR